jgi:hypothetical protein
MIASSASVLRAVDSAHAERAAHERLKQSIAPPRKCAQIGHFGEVAVVPIKSQFPDRLRNKKARFR